MNTITLIVGGISLLVIGVLLSRYAKDFFGFLWFITVGVWIEVFKESHSTGNGAGMMGGLICLVIICIQIALLLGFGVGLSIWYFFF